MFSNDFIVSIFQNNNALEERKDGVVVIPFNSEYTIRLRNKNGRRAVAKVYIDDVNVTEGGIIVPAYNYVDLERPTTHAKRFKFVDIRSDEAIESGKTGKLDHSNGVIKVEWQLEKEYRPVYTPTVRPNPWRSPPIVPYPTKPWREQPDYWCGNTYACSGVYQKGLNALSFAEASNCCASRSINSSEGCTVDGGHSNQTFGTSWIDTESQTTVIQLMLEGFYPPVSQPVKQKKHNGQYCEECGALLKNKRAKFCWNCGVKINV